MLKTNTYISGKAMLNLTRHALPLILLSVLTLIYNICDYYFLGHIKNTEIVPLIVSAVGSVSLYTWLSLGIVKLITTGVEILLPKLVIKGTAREYFSTISWMGLITNAVVSLSLYAFAPFFVSILGLQDQTFIYGVEYLRYTAIALFFILSNSIAATILVSFGQTSKILLISGIGVVVNLILDPILIIQYNLEIVGAGLSTILANLIPFCLFFYYLFKIGYFQFSKFNSNFAKKVFKLSLPISFSNIFFSIANIYITYQIINTGGDIANSVKLIGANIEAVAWQVFGTSFAGVLTAFISQNISANRNDRNKEIVKKTFICVTIFGLIFSTLIAIYGSEIFSLFTSQRDIIIYGCKYLYILSASQTFMCYEAIFVGIINGYGKTKWSSVLSVGGNILLIILLAINPYHSIESVFYILGIVNITRGVLALLFYGLIRFTLKNKDKPNKVTTNVIS